MTGKWGSYDNTKDFGTLPDDPRISEHDESDGLSDYDFHESDGEFEMFREQEVFE